MAGIALSRVESYVQELSECSSGFLRLDPMVKALAERLLNNVKIEDQKLVGEQCFEKVKVLRLNEFQVLTPLLAQAIAYLVKNNADIDSISLHGKEVSPELVEPIAHALKSNHRLQTLNLDVNHIGDLGACYLAEALRVNQTLQKLCLHGPLPQLKVGGSFHYNPIGDHGVSVLAGALRVNTALRHLRLSHNNMTNAGALCLLDALKMNDRLQYLNLDLTYGVDREILFEIQNQIQKNRKDD